MISAQYLSRTMVRFTILIVITLFITSCDTGEKQGTASNEEVAVSEAKPEAEKRSIILFYGNSITAGYQLDMDDAFPAVIQGWLDSLGYNYQVVNAGLSGETTASGKSRLDWVLRTVPDVFVLELGANDGLRGLPLEETRSNLQQIIDQVRRANPDVKILLAGMQVPPNLGQSYTETFRNIFPELATENEIGLIPFILEGVAGNPDLNLPDGIHPTPEGHQILASTVWEHLQGLVEK